MKSGILFLALLLSGIGCFAQTKEQANPPAESNREITATISSLLKELNGLYTNNPEKSISRVTALLEPDFEMSNFVVDVGGNARRSHLSLSDYKSQLNRNLSFDGLSMVFELEGINMIRAYDNFATASITVMQSYRLKEETLIKSKTFMNLYLKNSGGTWRIWEASASGVIKEQKAGNCPCEYIHNTGEGGNKYLSRILIPNGTDFAATEIQFEFSTAGDIKLIKATNNTYSWDGHKIICIKKGEETVTEHLEATATNEYEAMNAIITKHLYKANCIGLRAQIRK